MVINQNISASVYCYHVAVVWDWMMQLWNLERLKGAESRPQMYFWLVARGLYLKTTADNYSKKPKTYAIRLAKAVHIANYER